MQPFLQAPLGHFETSSEVVQRVLSTLSSNGADDAELYFESAQASSIILEDGAIREAHTNLDRGVGLRVVQGEQVGFAYTEAIREDTMQQAALTAASIAQSGQKPGPQAISVAPQERNLYPVFPPWGEVPVSRKLPIIEKAAKFAREKDPAVDKVTVTFTDAGKDVLVARLSGELVADVRPMSRLWVQVTAKRNGETQSSSANIAARESIDWFTDERIRQVAHEAVEKTLFLFDATQPPAGTMPVALPQAQAAYCYTRPSVTG